MNCEQVKELLSAYLDDVLVTEERRTVTTHLETCSECNGMLADFRHFDTLLSQLPRVAPNNSLRERIFTSTEYLEMTGTTGRGDRHFKSTVPYKSIRADRAVQAQSPQLVALPGGRGKQRSSSASAGDVFSPSATTRVRSRPRQGRWGQNILRIALVATVLLVLGVGGLIGWNLWQRQATIAGNGTGVMPPAGLQQGPLPAGLRFLFLRDGTLMSAPGTGNNTRTLPLTSASATVAKNWVVRPAHAGKSAGNMVAYIDLQQGRVHLIRSDGQNDTLIQQPLFKHGAIPATVWNTGTGATILGSLTWSNDGNMLAFVADPDGTGLTGLYIYTIDNNKVDRVTLPVTGSVSHLIWSPDSVRLAFTVTNGGKSNVLDYNTQNKSVLTLQGGLSTQTNQGDSVLSLQWSPNVTAPALTWSIGQPGHVHSLWIEHVGVAGITKPTLLISGDYAQANYSNTGIGIWLTVANNTSLPGDLSSIDLVGLTKNLTTGREVYAAQWGPDGNTLVYFEALSNNIGKLHMLNLTTGIDTLIASNVEASPIPTWSIDGQHLAYSTGMHVAIVDMHTPNVSSPLKLQGTIAAFSWSTISAAQLAVAVEDGQQGLYLADIVHGTPLRLDQAPTQGPIIWTQIP